MAHHARITELLEAIDRDLSRLQVERFCEQAGELEALWDAAMKEGDPPCAEDLDRSLAVLKAMQAARGLCDQLVRCHRDVDAAVVGLGIREATQDEVWLRRQLEGLGGAE